MRKKLKIFNGLIAVAIGLSLGACSESELTSEGGEITMPAEEAVIPNAFMPIELSAAQKATVDKLNMFAADLSNVIRDDEATQENVFCSPYSVGTLLSALANGAANTTLNEILSALHITDIDEMNDLYKASLSKLLAADNQCSLNMANSMWINDDFSVLPTFTSKLDDIYKSEIFVRDLPAPATRLEVNEWVENSTRGMLKDFYKNDFDKDCKLVLVNAIYFSGKWKTRFDVSNTREEVFNSKDGRHPLVDMMHLNDYYTEYLSVNGFDAIKIPYGNGAFEMIAIRADENTAFNSIINQISDRTSAWSKANVNLSLPKFKLEFNCARTIPFLEMLGIRTAWNWRANFTGISPDTDTMETAIYVNQVIHRAVINLDESGAEMASATGSNIIQGNYTPSENKVDFNLNRPFKFVIREKSTGLILFTGAVNNLDTKI